MLCGTCLHRLKAERAHPSLAAYTSREDTHTGCAASPGTTSDLWGMQVARATDGGSERLGERTPREGGGRGKKWRRKRNDLCKANVGLSQLWEITGKRLIMPTSTLLFSKTKEQPSPTPHSICQSCYPALPPFFLSSINLGALPLATHIHRHTNTHKHTHTHTHREREREREQHIYICVCVCVCVCVCLCVCDLWS